MIYPRLITPRLRIALAENRVVLVGGPRQAGKTTLTRKVADDGRTFLTFDDSAVLASARRDPTGFIRNIDKAVIDEVQRAPEVLLAIKQSVDEDNRAGRFLLTGSSNLRLMPLVADSLAGRMTTIELLPLAHVELLKRTSSFLKLAFEGTMPLADALVVGDALTAVVLAGGYPEALTRSTPAAKKRWYSDYVDAILTRDVKDLAQLDRLKDLPRLLKILSHHSGQLVNYSELGAPIGMNHVTTQKYVGIFEQLYLTRTLPPWSTNKLKRLIKTPKIHFLDSGLLAALQNTTDKQIKEDRGPFGALLETFVFAELQKLAARHDERIEFFHYRDQKMNEVDLVLENSDGMVVGIEVKASATVRSSDFAGLRLLQAACGKKFAMGLVLYDHHHSLPFGEGLAAVPLSALWS